MEIAVGLIALAVVWLTASYLIAKARGNRRQAEATALLGVVAPKNKGGRDA
jgi:hypothetical protein